MYNLNKMHALILAPRSNLVAAVLSACSCISIQGIIELAQMACRLASLGRSMPVAMVPGMIPHKAAEVRVPVLSGGHDAA